MKRIICESCGGTEFDEKDGFRICQFCNTKYQITPEDVTRKVSTISLDDDIKLLLQKCRDDPIHAYRYASLVLDIDPSNVDALRYTKR